MTLDSKGCVDGASARFTNNEGVAVGDHFHVRDMLKGNFEEFDKWFKAMKLEKWRCEHVDNCRLGKAISEENSRASNAKAEQQCRFSSGEGESDEGQLETECTPSDESDISRTTWKIGTESEDENEQRRHDRSR